MPNWLLNKEVITTDKLRVTDRTVNLLYNRTILFVDNTYYCPVDHIPRIHRQTTRAQSKYMILKIKLKISFSSQCALR